MKNEINLVLTKLYKFTENYKKDDLILGDWCIDYIDYKNNKIKNSIIPYHWDDKKKFNDDFEYIQNLYVNILEEISKKLNEIHNLNYDTKNWEILIGYWLQNFIVVCFDRYEMLERVSKKFDKINLYTLDDENLKKEIFFNDTNQAVLKFENDLWNQLFMEYLCTFFHNFNYNKKFKLKNKFIKENTFIFNNISNSNLNLKSRLSNIIYRFFPKKYKKFVFFRSAFKKIDLLKISLNLKNYCFPIKLPRPIKNQYDLSKRNWNLNNNLILKNSFEKFLHKNISKFIPMIYIEGFKDLKLVIEEFENKFNINQNPKIVFTSNSHYRDDVFKIWFTDKRFKHKTKLFIGLHGGGALSEKNQAMIYEQSISDKYFINGSLGSNKSNLINAGKILNNHKIRKSIVSKGKGILLTVVESRYACKLRPNPTSTSQQNKYFDDLLMFYNDLSAEVKKDLYVRLYPKGDFGWQQKRIWKRNIPNVKLDLGQQNFSEVAEKSKIIISTYNATTFNETLAVNIPTLIFWDKSLYEVPIKALPLFQKLEEVGIFHQSAKLASEFLNQNWHRIHLWWNNDKLQKIREEYCSNCSNINKDFVKLFSKEFK